MLIIPKRHAEDYFGLSTAYGERCMLLGRLSDTPVTAVTLSRHKEVSMSRLTVGKTGKQMQIIIGFRTALDRWCPKVLKPFFVILIALASAHSFSSQLLPPSRVTHEHECEYFEHVASADTGKDDGEYLDSDTARDRYGISNVSKKSLQAMGYTITKDLPMMLSGEQLLATGEKERFEFHANDAVMFKRGSGSSAETVSYTCSDTEVTYTAKNSKAFITPIVIAGFLGGKIVPIDFAVEEGLEFKFTLTCYDDWNEVLIDQSKVRGLSSWASSYNKDRTAITALYNAIKLDDRHEALTNQFKLNEDLIDYCDIKEIQQRPMKSEVNISSSTSIEDKDLDSDNTELTAAVNYIKDKIGNRWVRPANARNGMVVELIIYLVPTGEVVNVEVSYRDASATDAFVASVVKAVKKVGRFDKLSQLDSGLFDANFRKFTVKFKPEDLRL